MVTGPWFHCLMVSAGTLRSAADMGYTGGDCDQAAYLDRALVWTILKFAHMGKLGLFPFYPH